MARLEAALQARHAYRLIEEKVAECLHWSVLFVDALGFRSMGKGISAVLSRAGALAEAAEWLTCRETAALPGCVEAHQDELDRPLRIEDLLAHVSTATGPVLERIKRTSCARVWAEGESLLDGRRYRVPVEFVRRIGGPNGRAAGNRIEEALVHALNEVFERRAQITVLKNRMVVPTIDPASVTHPVIREQMDFLSARGIDMVIKDLSFGGVLPCVGVYFFDPHVPETYQFHHFFKVGASCDREYALMRAFTEYVQGRRLDEFIDGSAAEQARILQHDFRALRCMPDDGDNFLSAFLFGFVPCRDAAFLRDGDVKPFDTGTRYTDCLDDIEQAKAVCRALGKDCVAVDLTDPGIGFPVVHVVVPGYSDVLPFHPARSRVLFQEVARKEVLDGYED
ncbi:MAG: YcaO-like family protein [Lentisphaerae bacterium]|nr:YcaO-like family protein [Lentisphaerota bacterium]